MNKEEIKVMIKDCVYSDDGITYMSDKQYNNCINIIEQLQKENQKHKEVIEKAIEYIDDWLFNVGGMGACMDYKDIKEILDILKGGENE